jgi:hypothetical protein
MGLRAEEVEPFLDRVQSLVRQVEELCQAHGTTVEGLPGPSRRIYQFLKELNTEHIRTLQPGELDEPRPVPLVLRNVLRLEDYFADRLWASRTLPLGAGDALRELQAEIQRQVVMIERACADHQAAPGALTAHSSRIYCWLKFLANAENLASHLAALERANTALGEHPCDPARPVRVHLVNTTAIWGRRLYQNLVRLKVSEGFLNADSQVWQALVTTVLSGRHPASTRLLQEFTQSEDFSEVLCELESLAESADASPRGCVHDLEQSFARVNAAYFNGGMAKPKLVWNRALTGRKFGHYRASTDTVMLSASLDVPAAAPLVVDFVMYHELLHKKHGVALVNGRRVAHGPAFRAEERQFSGYAQAQQLLAVLGRGA